MQELSDTAKLLYRDYAAASAGWRSERAGAEKQLVRAQEEAALASAANRELEAALAVLEGRKNGGGSEADVRQQYVETVRRMAVVQVKHAKLARELEVGPLFGARRGAGSSRQQNAFSRLIQNGCLAMANPDLLFRCHSSHGRLRGRASAQSLSGWRQLRRSCRTCPVPAARACAGWRRRQRMPHGARSTSSAACRALRPSRCVATGAGSMTALPFPCIQTPHSLTYPLAPSPPKAYESLVDKHTVVVAELRRLQEERGAWPAPDYLAALLSACICTQ